MHLNARSCQLLHPPYSNIIGTLYQLFVFGPQVLLLVGAGVTAATRRPFFRPRSINTQALVDQLTAGIPLSDFERRALYKLVEPPPKERGW